MNKRLFFLLRCFTFLVGMNITALGISTITNTNLGTTPITSIPYAVNAIFPLTVGVYTGIVNSLLVVAQRFILGRKRFHLIHAMQLPPLLFFGMSIDFWLHNTNFVLALPYLERLCFLGGGIVLMAIGILVQVVSNVIVLPGEGLVLAVAYRSRKSFGSIKVLCDSSMVVIAMCISFIGLGTIVGVREGTIASAVLTGFVVRFLSFIVGKVTGHGQGEPGGKQRKRRARKKGSNASSKPGEAGRADRADTADQTGRTGQADTVDTSEKSDRGSAAAASQDAGKKPEKAPEQALEEALEEGREEGASLDANRKGPSNAGTAHPSSANRLHPAAPSQPSDKGGA